MKVHLQNVWYLGGPLADKGSSAKFLVPRGVCWQTKFIYQISGTWGVHWQTKVHLPNLNSQTFRCGHQIGHFALHKTNKKNAICKVQTLSQKYVLLDQLMFKLITVPDKEKAVLAIPEMCVAKIISLYHDTLFAGHQGVIKTYLTMSSKFFIQNLLL